MNSLLLRWLFTTLAVAVAVKLTGMHADGWPPLIVMALLLGVINAVLRPVLMLLSLPFILVTLGFFILIVNAFLFWLAGGLVPGLEVGGFGNAFFGSVIVSIVNWLLSAFIRGSDGRVQILTRHDQVGGSREKVVAGRVIGE
jgi:putative membrane protein